jgi:hypothetical protein
MVRLSQSSRKRWFRPGTWGILVFILALASTFAWFSDQPRRRLRVATAAKKLGGYVSLDEEHLPNHKPPPKPKAPSFRWMAEQLGPGFAHELTLINLDGKPVSDSDLALLAGLKRLRILYLNATRISDQGLVHLSGLSDLQKLELRETAIGNEGLAHLSGLRELRALFLHSTKVGDRGMAHLKKLRKLRELHLGRTSVGDSGLAELVGLGELEALYLQHTPVSDAGLVYLERMANLRFVQLEGTGVTEEGVARLNRARSERGLPALTIYQTRSGGRPVIQRPGPAPIPSEGTPDGYGFEGGTHRVAYTVS